MNPSEAPLSTRVKVGIFTVLGLLLIGAVTVFVNDKPQWWKPCQLVHINVEDATGLKAKSAVRSLGLEIGFIRSVVLSETHVELGICITEAVEVLPSTRAYVRSEGFLGDKFVELKPVKYVGKQPERPAAEGGAAPASTEAPHDRAPAAVIEVPAEIVSRIWGALFPSAWAQPSPSPTEPRVRARTGSDRQIPVGEQTEDVSKLVKRVDSLVSEMTSLTENLREAISPEDLKATMKQLNRTLENASRTLGPQGNLNQTAQRTLAKLEDAIEQLRDQITRINQGEGTLGRLLNDPVYADELLATLKSANQLLGRANQIRFVVDVGAEHINGFENGRGYFRLQIWPTPDRYYLVGLTSDPRGAKTITTNTTEAGGVTVVNKTTSVDLTNLPPTVMLGKVFFKRLDLSAGVLNGDGAASTMLLLGPRGTEGMISLRGDVYTRTDAPIDGRLSLRFSYGGAYLMTGLETLRKVDGHVTYSYGAGVSFDDNDIKLLFALR